MKCSVCFHSGDHLSKRCRGRLHGVKCPCDGTSKFAEFFGPVSADGTRFRVGDLAHPTFLRDGVVGVVVSITAKTIAIEFGPDADLRDADINIRGGRFITRADRCVKASLPCTYSDGNWDTDPDDWQGGMVLMCQTHDQAATWVVYDHNVGAEHGPCRFMRQWDYVVPDWANR